MIKGTDREMASEKEYSNKSAERMGIVMLFIASFIWGCAFVAQRVGADNMPPCAFLAVRNWVAVAVMTPVIRAAERIREKRGEEIVRADRKTYWLGGLCCGFFLFISSVRSQ